MSRKPQQQMTEYLDRIINALHQRQERETMVTRDGTRVEQTHARDIDTHLFEVRPHGRGWTAVKHYVFPQRFLYRTTDVNDENLAPTHMKLSAETLASAAEHEEENTVAPGDTQNANASPVHGLSALKQHAVRWTMQRTTPLHLLPVVWWEEITDPLTVWQVLYVMQNVTACDAVTEFYNAHKNVLQTTCGLCYSPPQRWIQEYDHSTINRICAQLQHDPMFKTTTTSTADSTQDATVDAPAPKRAKITL